MINSINNSQNKYKLPIAFKARIVPTEKQAKYFYGEYPLLAKFIPQHCYGFQQYDGTKFTRYMLTTGCSVCSKLSIYDKVQKIGLFSHVDSDLMLLRNSNKIKDEIFKRKMKPENLVGIDSQGVYGANEGRFESIKNFFFQLGLKEENIHQPQEALFDGGVLDLKNGQIFDLDSWSRDYGKQLKETIEAKLKSEPKAYNRAIEQYKEHYDKFYPIIGVDYTQV